MYITVQCHIDYNRVRERAYIFESLFGAPPVTLATRRRASSAFRSFSWFRSSAFVFCLSSYTLILAFTFNKSNKKPYSAKSGKKWNIRIKLRQSRILETYCAAAFVTSYPLWSSSIAVKKLDWNSVSEILVALFCFLPKTLKEKPDRIVGSGPHWRLKWA